MTVCFSTFIYLFSAGSSLLCRLSLVALSGGYSLVVVWGFLMLGSMGFRVQGLQLFLPVCSVLVAPGLTCSVTCGNWQGSGMEAVYFALTSEFLPLNHQGSPWLSFFFFNFNIFFQLHHMACGLLVPQPGIRPVPLQWKSGVPNHQTSREVPNGWFLDSFTRYGSLQVSCPHHHWHPKLQALKGTVGQPITTCSGNTGKLRSSSPKILVSFPLAPSKLAGSRRVLSIVISSISQKISIILLTSGIRRLRSLESCQRQN